jgi:hypothetical protein
MSVKSNSAKTTFVEPSFAEPTFAEPALVEASLVEINLGEPVLVEPVMDAPALVEPLSAEPAPGKAAAPRRARANNAPVKAAAVKTSPAGKISRAAREKNAALDLTSAPLAGAAVATASPRAPARRSRAIPAPARFDVSFPGEGRIRFVSKALFSNPRSAFSRQFFERAFLAPEVIKVEIDAIRGAAEISFKGDELSRDESIRRISGFLARGSAASEAPVKLAFPSDFDESTEPQVRLFRHGARLSSWAVKHEIDGRIRLENPALYRKRVLCQAIERELMNAFGVDRYSTNELTCTVLIHYDPAQIK